MWLSIIIPLYNCEQYLPRCLDSVLRQGLDPIDYEVIIVDDGSSDRSASVARQYCSEHRNFRLLSQENVGVGAARNRGIDHARGDYVEMLDADDWLLPGGLPLLRQYAMQAKGEVDMYTFYSRTVDAAYSPEEWDHVAAHRVVFDGSFGQWGTQHGFGWSVWSRIISRRLLLSSGVRFTGHKVGEDVLFLARLMQCVDARVVATDLNIYRYFVRPQSAVNNIDPRHNAQACLGYADIFCELRAMSSAGLYPVGVYASEMHICQVKAFLRMISGATSIAELKELRTKVMDAGVLPVTKPGTKAERLYNFALSHMSVLYPLSIFYRKVFLRYIKPHIKRN